jgi:hypothetical protein
MTYNQIFKNMIERFLFHAPLHKNLKMQRVTRKSASAPVEVKKAQPKKKAMTLPSPQTKKTKKVEKMKEEDFVEDEEEKEMDFSSGGSMYENSEDASGSSDDDASNSVPMKKRKVNNNKKSKPKKKVDRNYSKSLNEALSKHLDGKGAFDIQLIIIFIT